jgi:hypothetical protein
VLGSQAARVNFTSVVYLPTKIIVYFYSTYVNYNCDRGPRDTTSGAAGCKLLLYRIKPNYACFEYNNNNNANVFSLDVHSVLLKTLVPFTVVLGLQFSMFFLVQVLFLYLSIQTAVSV